MVRVQASLSLTGIIVSNMLGIVLLMILLIGNWRRFSESGREYIWLMAVIVCAFFCCVVDPLTFAMDGKPGKLAHAVVLWGNTCLFASNMLVGFAWVSFLGRHLNGRLQHWHTIALLGAAGLGTAVLLLNFFVPVAFSVSAENVYTRGPLFWLFVGLDSLCLLDSLILYYHSQKRGGILKFFPVWIFVAPVVIGMASQSLFYGISVVWPCVAIAVAGVLTSLQNESIFLDPLTGLFNRAYLDHILRSLARTQKENYGCILLDLNNFKSINDRFGHAAGDDAMRQVGGILKSAAGSLGSVIRYAGDEFVVLLHTGDMAEVDACCCRIAAGFEAFNAAAAKPYRLSAAMGCGKLDFKAESLDAFMGRIDKQMYENKNAYYAKHTENNSRRC